MSGSQGTRGAGASADACDADGGLWTASGHRAARPRAQKGARDGGAARTGRSRQPLWTRPLRSLFAA